MRHIPKGLPAFGSKVLGSLQWHARKPEKILFGHIPVETLLHGLVTLFEQAQRELNQRSLDAGRAFDELGPFGFSLENDRIIQTSERASDNSSVLPFSSMVSFRRYKISELAITFALASEGRRTYRRRSRFRIVSFDAHSKDTQPALIRLTGQEHVTAELFVGDLGNAKLVVTT